MLGNCCRPASGRWLRVIEPKIHTRPCPPYVEVGDGLNWISEMDQAPCRNSRSHLHASIHNHFNQATPLVNHRWFYDFQCPTRATALTEMASTCCLKIRLRMVGTICSGPVSLNNALERKWCG